jgi:hypothetical protein
LNEIEAPFGHIFIRNDNGRAAQKSIPYDRYAFFFFTNVREIFHQISSIIVVPTINGLVVGIPIVMTDFDGNQGPGMKVFPYRFHRFICSRSNIGGNIATSTYLSTVECIYVVSTHMFQKFFFAVATEVTEGTYHIITTESKG